MPRSRWSKAANHDPPILPSRASKDAVCSYGYEASLEGDVMQPGIYFGLDEDEYHAAAALSNSGIKNLLTSPMDFWARCPWLNPDFEPEEKNCWDIGKAYDARITEGESAFYMKYAPALEPDDYPNALRSANDLRQALADLGEKRGGSKPELIDRLIAADSNMATAVWDIMLDDHAKYHKGKTLLSRELITKIEISAAMIEKHPQLCRAFTGGYPQVSIFWADRDSGCPMKMRADYLKTRAIVDLKTFSNPFGKPIDRAVTYAMANMKYHIQAAVYQEGVECAKEMLRGERDGKVFGEPDSEWLGSFWRAQEHKFLFIFQQTGVAPVARGYEFPKGLVYDCGKVVIRDMKEQYMYFIKEFGADPWVDATEIRAVEDSEFPVFMVE